MFEFLPNVWNDFHALAVHFPIGMLFLSFVLTLLSRFNLTLNEASWAAQVFGALATIPAIVSGLIAHEPYENTPIINIIEQHQFLALIGSAVVIALTVWRWQSRRRGGDIGFRSFYQIIAVVGIVWLFLLGGTGGNLVYQHGVNVRGTNPILNAK
jgi:uncharacterized membrane protein